MTTPSPADLVRDARPDSSDDLTAASQVDRCAQRDKADALRAQIVELATRLTNANDRGDAAGDLLEGTSDDPVEDYYVAGLMQASEDADQDYNLTKAELFAACHALAAAVHHEARGPDEKEPSVGQSTEAQALRGEQE